MSTTKKVTGKCRVCGGLIQFAAEDIGKVSKCALCDQETILTLAVPEQTPAVPVRAIIFTGVTLAILVGGLIAAQIAVKRAKRLVGQSDGNVAQNPQPNSSPPAGPFAMTGFAPGDVTLERSGSSSLVYAVGTVTNLTDRRRFGVKVELDLFDRTGEKIGTTKDYQNTIEPRAEWRFKALVMDGKADSAKLTVIKEDQ